MTSSSSSVEYFNPHVNGPESLRNILRRTTRKPFCCHRKSWCDTHLDILRVEGLDKDYPVEQVLGRSLQVDPSDTELVKTLQQIPYMGERDGDVRAVLHGLVRAAPYLGSTMKAENTVASIGHCFLEHLRTKVRKYPAIDDNCIEYEIFFSLHSV